MEKREDWMTHFTSYVNESRANGGHESCASFVAGGVKAMTGEDHAIPGTPAEQLQWIRNEGYKTLDDYLATYSKKLAGPLFGQIGDIAVLADTSGKNALGLVIGADVVVLRDDGQLSDVPLSQAKRVYRL